MHTRPRSLVQFSITFTDADADRQWQHTIINYANAQTVSALYPSDVWGRPGYGSAGRAGATNDWFDAGGIFTVVGATTGGTNPYVVTDTPGVGGFTSALVLNDGGKFWTRVGRNGGDFTYSSETITINADPVPNVPEPATFVLLGSALIGLGLLRRRK